MDWMQTATLDLCDTYLCCNHWCGQDMRDLSPDCDENKSQITQMQTSVGPAEEDDSKDVRPRLQLAKSTIAELKLAKCQFEINSEFSSQFCKENKLVKAHSFDFGSTEESDGVTDQLLTADARKNKIVHPTLKEIAERYIAAQKEEELFRAELEENEKQYVVDSVVTLEDDKLSDCDVDNSLRNKVTTSNISELLELSLRDYQAPEQLQKESSHDVEVTHSADEQVIEVKDTTSKDSGFGEECSGKRKMVRLPNPQSHDSDGQLSSPGANRMPTPQPSSQLYQRSASLKQPAKRKSVMKRMSTSFRRKDKGPVDQGSGSEIVAGASSNTMVKNKKKKDPCTGTLSSQQPSFVIRGKRKEKVNYKNTSGESSCSSNQES